MFDLSRTPLETIFLLGNLGGGVCAKISSLVSSLLEIVLVSLESLDGIVVSVESESEFDEDLRIREKFLCASSSLVVLSVEIDVPVSSELEI